MKNLNVICQEVHETINKCISIDEITSIAKENEQLIDLNSQYNAKLKLFDIVIATYSSSYFLLVHRLTTFFPVL